MRSANRSDRINWLTWASIGIAAGLLAASPALAEPITYTLTPLGTLGGPSSAAYGINASGQVVGWADTSRGRERAFLYSDGAMTALGTFGGGSSCAYGINDTGQVVGWADTCGGHPRAFLYSDGAMTGLGTLGGTSSCAEGISDTGRVVGWADTFCGQKCAFLYSGGKMAGLDTLSGSQTSHACSVNNAGQVAGYVTRGTHAQAFLYDGGTMCPLGTLLGGQDSWAYGVNDAGEVVGAMDSVPAPCSPTYGWHLDAPGGYGPFLCSGGVMTCLGTLGGDAGDAYGINDAGQIVGGADTSRGREHAFVYRNGAMADLNALIPPHSGWTLQVAQAINDSGQIVGYGIDPAGETEAFLLTPTPEPPSLALLGGAGAVLLGRRWRPVSC